MKNNLTFQGIVKNITSEEIGKDKKYIKTSILVEEDEPQYPKSLIVDIFDKPEVFNGIEINDNVIVHYNTKVTNYNGRDFNNISFWKIEKLNSEPKKEQSISESSEKNIFEDEEKNNDLPF